MDKKKENKLRPLENMGKIPPQDTEMEQAVLGCILMDSEALIIVIDLLTVQSFFDPKNAIIFGEIYNLFLEQYPIDILTVTSRLKNNGKLEEAGGPGYISFLTNRIGSSLNIEFYARIVAEHAIRRNLINVSQQIFSTSYHTEFDVFDLLSKAEEEIIKISEEYTGKQSLSMLELTKTSILEIERARKNISEISGVPSGLHEIDSITAGWQKKDLIIIAGRPAMGKTALVLSLLRNAAIDSSIPIAVFSLEMSSVQLTKRLISAETEVSSEKMRRGNVSDADLQQIHDKIQRLAVAPIYIDDTPALTILQFKAKAKRMKKQHDVQMIVVDYLQLMTTGSDSNFREQEIAKISGALKQTAKELDLPIIALAQLSRSVETRGGDKRPILSDLRESGSIEQDADLICFLHRPEYYGITADESGESLLGVAEFIVAKHRNGGTGTARMKYIPQYTRFENSTPKPLFNNDLSPNEEFDDFNAF